MFSNQALKKLLIPLVIEQILAMLVGMTDTLMVSSAGEAAVSGVALVDMVNYLMITILTAVATGGAVIVSQYLGSRQSENAEKSAGQLVMISAAISLAIMAICLLFCRQLLQLLFGTVEADVMQAAMTYFLITACSFPMLGIYNASAALFRSAGKTDITMYISLLMNTVNIIGDFIGVQLLDAGVAGVAVPTLIPGDWRLLSLQRLPSGKGIALCFAGKISSAGTHHCSAGFCVLLSRTELKMVCLHWDGCW